jgi:hypothetical protein
MVSKSQIKSNQSKTMTIPHNLNVDNLLQVRSVFRDIGNSKGVIISQKMMDLAGIHTNNVVIEASKGEIRIRPVDDKIVNTDLSSWGKQFKNALKSDQIPDSDLFDGMKNKFDEEEW